MNAKSTALSIAALACALSGPVMADSSKDWVEAKGEKELRALYSNKTHKGKDWVAHFRDDRKRIIVSNQAKTPVPHTWATKGDDQVCTTSSASTSCYRYQRNGKKPDDIMATFVAQPVTFFFKVEDGIPKF